MLDLTAARTQVATLVSYTARHDFQYYVLHAPSVSDSEYDGNKSCLTPFTHSYLTVASMQCNGIEGNYVKYPRLRCTASRLRSLLAAGKMKKVALVACMRKLLVILNAMVKNNTPWREMKAA